MDPNDAAGFAPSRAGFAPEAGRVGGKLFRKLGLGQEFLAVQVSHRHLRGRSEKERAVLQAVHVCLELWQLGGADHAITPNEKRRADFEIAMLPRMQI